MHRVSGRVVCVIKRMKRIIMRKFVNFGGSASYDSDPRDTLSSFVMAIQRRNQSI